MASKIRTARNNKKKKNTNAARNNGNAIAVRIPRQPRQRSSPLQLSPYASCVLSGTSHPGMNYGYPDGDVRASVTQEFRFNYTIRPQAGLISFLLAPSSNGTVNVLAGLITSRVYNYDISTPTGYVDNQFIEGKGQISEQFLQNFLTTLGGTPGSPPVGVPAFRPVACVADCRFTGSTMMNNGSVLITKVANSEVMTGNQVQIDAATDYPMGEVNFAYPGTSQLMPSSQVLAARESFTIRSVPVKPEYETTRASVTNALDEDNRYFSVFHNSANTRALAPSYHPACPWTLVRYSGLDDSASVTITVRYCCQFTIGPTDVRSAIARPSPSEDPSYVARIAAAVAAAPVAQRIAGAAMGMLGEAAKGVFNLAANAYLPGPVKMAIMNHH